ncbi:PIN domain nuclease [Actinoplanes sp. NEAU-A12]|uniref:Ribonuclease VapC n=1 Tax=Actinoplanes sandaracinus TaxID=3045177 RepID=A0ABT6WET0_9ACTN|nr:PIN domain nuclease [Actinoplanes sandaracinus]MDI6098236.1 PIN domain nuclease [Actinoplanes sandaracinus]
MNETKYLVDTSALIRLLLNPHVLCEWRRTVTDGLISTCTITEIELLYTARSHADRERQEALLRELFGWVVMPDGVFERAARLQAVLAAKGAHRSAGPVDLLTAVTAEEHGLTLLHYDRDFVRVAEVTGQPVHWLAKPGTVD